MAETTVRGSVGDVVRVRHPDGSMTVVIYGDDYSATTTLDADTMAHMRRQRMGRAARQADQPRETR